MPTSYGLIGYPLSHSFSERYFHEKFLKLGVEGYSYINYPLQSLDGLRTWVQSNSTLRGFNVTIPHKETIIGFLDDCSAEAAQIGAVNTVKIENGKLKGYNTDAQGFRTSLLHWFKTSSQSPGQALVLGTGGASKAVQYVLRMLNIPYLTVSRHEKKGDLIYDSVTASHLRDYPLIINTTPLGMAPITNALPPLPYENLSPSNWLFDLIYNPEQTAFLRQGERHGARTRNGYEMLVLQAENAWEIWEND